MAAVCGLAIPASLNPKMPCVHWYMRGLRALTSTLRMLRFIQTATLIRQIILLIRAAPTRALPAL